MDVRLRPKLTPKLARRALAGGPKRLLHRQRGRVPGDCNCQLGLSNVVCDDGITPSFFITETKSEGVTPSARQSVGRLIPPPDHACPSTARSTSRRTNPCPSNLEDLLRAETDDDAEEALSLADFDDEQ
jgi:hypothetical protein